MASVMAREKQTVLSLNENSHKFAKSIVNILSALNEFRDDDRTNKTKLTDSTQ
jgi:hypothetical protein